MNMLQFARDLARFESRLEQVIYRTSDGYCGGYCSGELAAVAASYHALLGHLTDGQDPAAAIADALRIYQEIDAANDDRRRETADRRQAEYDEAARRHQLAVTAECPYCGAAPGAACRTAGPSGKAYPKGVHDHKDRYRAAAGLLKPEDPHDPR